MAGWENPIARLKRLQSEQAGNQLNPYAHESVAILAVTGNLAVIPHYQAHYQAQLVTDLARLKAITDIPAKIEAKRDMVDNYRPFIKDYLASGQTTRNDLAVQLMIWLFDVGDIDTALPLALTLIQQGQPMPDRFNSTMETFVCDYTYDWANKLLVKGQSASPYLDNVVEAIDLHFWDLPLPVASKMYALLAKFRFNDERYADVVALCTHAETVNPVGHGTKTLKAKALAKL